MANDLRSSAPTPEVQFVPQVLRRIAQGDIRMPAFQRGYVWKDGQVLELLESIYNGFPIGSALLWRVESRVLRPESPKNSFLPDVKERYPASFVLDGLQRLSSLYAVFNFQKSVHPPFFDVHLALRTDRFVASSDVDESSPTVPLSILFNPSAFIRHHTVLAKEKDGDQLVSKAVKLHSIFQEYLVPIVTISDRSVSDVVKIFERINNTGTKLSTVDFMRAVTWSEKFDLNAQLESIAAAIEATGLVIPQETLVKVLAIAMNRNVTPDAIVELRRAPADALAKGVARAEVILKRVAAFLAEHLHIRSSDLVPYEAQLLALTGFFSRDDKPKDQQTRDLLRWFWTASLNEDMQGRSEYQVSRIVETIQQRTTIENLGANRTLVLTPETLMSRRFRWGTALSSALACLFARAGARSLLTGELIDREQYMSGDAGASFVALVHGGVTRDSRGTPVPGNKVIANVIVASSEEISFIKRTPAARIFRTLSKKYKSDAESVLASQFITPTAAQSLQKGRHQDFLSQRAEAIHQFASELAYPPAREAAAAPRTRARNRP